MTSVAAKQIKAEAEERVKKTAKLSEAVLNKECVYPLFGLSFRQKSLVRRSLIRGPNWPPESMGKLKIRNLVSPKMKMNWPKMDILIVVLVCSPNLLILIRGKGEVIS